ncbi:hypothetical protein DSM112329_00558 [Paraconexibacter sp. AEG42_29]|uniref:Proton-coupled antiporter flippase LtaA n=1 Tax=Paraconexibacter sp. AEG42_29 TaxID=2997339 RepID=A0AAU7APY4_9ACTN
MTTPEPPGAPAAEAHRAPRGGVTGWVLFDFATTTFSFVVVTRYLNDWIIDERGEPDIVIGIMTAVISVALLLTLPALGGRADRLGRHLPVLRPFSALSIGATALLAFVGPTWLALTVAGIAIFAFYVADSQYHPLLATVAPPERRGRVSGTAVAAGLVGSFLALLLLGALVDEGHAQDAFLPAAVIYGLFALPLLVGVREPRRPGPAVDDGSPTAVRRLIAGVRRARGTPYGRLLLARFLYVDAVATAIQFMAVYARRTGDFDDDTIDLVLAVSILTAIAGAVGAGLLAARRGSAPVIRGTVMIVVAALLVVAVSGSGWVLWVAGPCIGGALGALSTVDRILMLELVPDGRRGEEFGLFALVGKLSVGFGPLVLWGGTVLVGTELGLSKLDASRCAVIMLALSAAGGLVLLRGLKAPPRSAPVASPAS